jgi:hypothetical protein
VANSKCTGDIIVNMDDDDYYPPTRIEHAVAALMHNPTALIAGSSIMHTYFKHSNQMFRFGPYGPNHATAATFAFKRELLNTRKYDDGAAMSEEPSFLGSSSTDPNRGISLIQLDSDKTILVISHACNTFDKRRMISGYDDTNRAKTPAMMLVHRTVKSFIPDAALRKFILTDVDVELDKYALGTLENKPDIVEHLKKTDDARDKTRREFEAKCTPENMHDLIQTNRRLVQDNNMQAKQIEVLKSIMATLRTQSAASASVVAKPKLKT